MDIKRRSFLGGFSAVAASALMALRTRQIAISEMLLHDVPGGLRKHKVLLLTPEAKAWAAKHNVTGYMVPEKDAIELWRTAAKRKVKDQ